jgi:hypothetical protein
MMQDFLKTYIQAKNLDDKQYDSYFPKKVKRSDFLLFDEQIICEVKETQNIKVKNKIEKLSKQIKLSENAFKRGLYRSIEEALSKANDQIGSSKQALNLPDAFGLIILENTMIKDLSILSIIDAANRKMLRGLNNTDCILCLDFVNTFSNSDGNPVQVAQVVSRDTEKSETLLNFLNHLIKDFCIQTGTPLIKGWNIEKGSQDWIIDESGDYIKYTAKIDFKLPVSEKNYTWRQRVAYLLDRWWWIIPLPFMFYDWFIR